MPRVDVDILAQNLGIMAGLARRMPPSWDGGGDSFPCVGPGGEYVGRILPGRGMLLGTDLKHLGIVRSIPHVFQDSPFWKLKELLRSDKGAIQFYDDIIAARCGGNYQDIVTFKPSITTVASTWSSLFSVAAGLPAAGSYTAISGGAVHTRADAGAFSLGLSNPGGANSKYILTMGWWSGTAINVFLLVDLLVGAGAIPTTSTGPHTINSTALTRYTSGSGVMMNFEVTTQLGTGAPTATVTYTNQTPTGSRTTTFGVTASLIVGRLAALANGPFLALQSTDYGVTSVQSISYSVGQSAGALALNLFKPLIMSPGVGANAYSERDQTTNISALTELVTASGALGCLVPYIMSTGSTSGVINMFMRTAEG